MDSNDNIDMYMRRQIANDKLHDLEAKVNMMQYQIDGWCVYPVIRFFLYMALVNLPLSRSSKDQNLAWFPQVLIAGTDILKSFSLPRARYAVFVQSSNRSELEEEHYKDVYFDDLLKEMGGFIKIEKIVNKEYVTRGKRALIKSDITSTYIRLFTRLISRFYQPVILKDLMREVSQELVNHLSLDNLTAQRISNQILYFYWSKKLFNSLLKKTGARILLLTTAYMNHSLVAAAKELGMHVVEFQHGLIDRYHSGYSWDRNAREYKSIMPIPDQIFLYGDYWRNEIMANGFWEAELTSVGSLRIDQYRRLGPGMEKYPEFTLVVTTQSIDTAKIIQFFAELLQLIHPSRPFRLIFKLHPGETNKSEFNHAFKDDPRVNILLSSEGPSTFELLVRSQLHASIYSTCHYEAVGLGTPTVILPFTDHQTIIELYQAGHAYLTHTPYDLFELVNNFKPSSVPPKVSHFYFMPNSLQNMLEKLN